MWDIEGKCHKELEEYLRDGRWREFSSKAKAIIAGSKIEELEESEAGYKTGHAPYQYILAAIPIALKAKIMVETGVSRSALSTRIFLFAANILNAELYSFDLYDFPEARRKIREGGYREDLWHFVIMDSVEAGKRWSKGTIDFLFLDSDHSSTHVYNELQAWKAHLSEKSIIITDDALDAKSRGPGQPLKAFWKFQKENPEWQITYFTEGKGEAFLFKSLK